MDPLKLTGIVKYELDNAVLTEYLDIYIQILLIGCSFGIIAGLIIYGAVKAFMTLSKHK